MDQWSSVICKCDGAEASAPRWLHPTAGKSWLACQCWQLAGDLTSLTCESLRRAPRGWLSWALMPGPSLTRLSDIRPRQNPLCLLWLNPWKSHPIISAISHWLLSSALLSVGERDPHSCMKTRGREPSWRLVTICVIDGQLSFMFQSIYSLGCH